MVKKSYQKTSSKKVKIKLSPKGADEVWKQEFTDEETGVNVKNIIKFTPEPYFFRQTIKGLKRDDR